MLLAIIIKALAIVGLLAFLAAAFVFYKFRSIIKDSHNAMDEDYKIIETADWFGKTGLDDETERELAHYLRREFGERLSQDAVALKAGDLRYLGVFTENQLPVHYWEIPRSNKNEPPYFAYIEVDPKHKQTCTGWGDRTPPNISAQ